MITLSELSSMPPKGAGGQLSEEDVDYRDEYLAYVQKIRQHLEGEKRSIKPHVDVRKAPLLNIENA